MRRKLCQPPGQGKWRDRCSLVILPSRAAASTLNAETIIGGLLIFVGVLIVARGNASH